MEIFRDTLTQAILRLRIVCRDRITVAVFVISAICFLFCMSDMNRAAEELANIPIGVVNLSDEKQAQALVERLDSLSSLHVERGTFDELVKRLEDGYLQCIYVIREDYAKCIAQGKTQELLTVYHVAGNNVSYLISDIVAGEMMYDLCLAQGYLQYEKLEPGDKPKYTKEEYENYTAGLIGTADFDFAFRFTFVDTQAKQEVATTENAVFYRQGIASAAAMLISVFCMTLMAGVVMEKEQGISRRRGMLAIGRVDETAGNVLAAAVALSVLAMIFSVCSCVFADRICNIPEMFGVTLFYALVMTALFLVAAKALKRLFAYQMLGGMIVLGFGVCGFLGMVEGILIHGLPEVLCRLPNNLFVEAVTELLK